MQQPTINYQANQSGEEFQIPEIWVQGLTNSGINHNKKHRKSSSSQQGRSHKETQKKQMEVLTIILTLSLSI